MMMLATFSSCWLLLFPLAAAALAPAAAPRAAGGLHKVSFATPKHHATCVGAALVLLLKRQLLDVKTPWQ